MDFEQEELQFLGLAGIFRESSKILNEWRKLFARIALSLVLPLSLLFLAHVYFSHRFFSAIAHDDDALDSAAPNSAAESSALRRLASDWSSFLLFKAFYLVALLVLALLSTAAVVYSVASIYTSRELPSFGKVLSVVVPRVWRRLMATFLWAFVALFAFNSCSLLIFIAAVLIAGDGDTGTFVLLFIILPLYLIGLVYISVVWHLASVVSVLEDVRGLEAMKKSRLLIKGKVGMASAIFVLLTLCFVGVEIVFRRSVIGGGLSFGPRFFLGGLVVVLLCAVTLFALVVQTVVYFVCKSYHHENIDKSTLSDHLEVYLGEYVPLTAKDVQLEQFHV